MKTLGAFLQPLNNGRDELGHILANDSGKTKKTSDFANSTFELPAEIILEWKDFYLEIPMENYLLKECQVQWRPWVPNSARIIYGERQLEALYLQTLITRVNIALDNAIPPDEDRVTIVIGPGAFESVYSEVTNNRILPDWVVVHGSYDTSMEGGMILDLQGLADEHRILAVGETKLVRQVDSQHVMPHTKACYSEFLGQLQGYCRNLSTRFGFVLSNKELVVAQYIREEDAGPRPVEERGLRSRTATEQLNPGLVTPHGSQNSTSLSFQPVEMSFEMSFEVSEHGNPDSPKLPAFQRPLKRPHSLTSPDVSPSAARSGHGIADRSFSGSSQVLYTPTVPASPPQMPDTPTVPGSPPQMPDTHMSDTHLQVSDTHLQVSDTHLQVNSSSSPVLQTSSSQDHSNYTSSDRQVEVGEIQLRSFGMPEVVEESEETHEEDESPYKALFSIIMMARDLKLQGQLINI